MKTTNQTYDTIANRYENRQLTARQAKEFEMLQEDMADGSIDGDEFSLHWNDLFPPFNFMKCLKSLLKGALFLTFECFVLFLLSKSYNWPVLVSAFFMMEFIGFLFIRRDWRSK